MTGRRVLLAARIIVLAGLAVDAYVHLDLASTYAEAGGVINEGVLFCAEAVAAMLAALVVAIYGSRISYLAGFAVAASALAAILVSRYVGLGAIGPFPDLYDPVWFGEKILAACRGHREPGGSPRFHSCRYCRESRIPAPAARLYISIAGKIN
ncbi:MAG TPA: hypothetical protein VMU94_30795 [Streptosporangiaceae bacterium]|nr:hypothetical protein [Streptosporangiaceae bacterium]